MSITMNRDRVIQFLRRAIKERGAEYVYEQSTENGPACAYVREGQPSCLVGYVLNYAKPDLIPLIAEWERTEAAQDDYDEDSWDYDPGVLTLEDGFHNETGIYELASALRNSDEIVFTRAALALLAEVQRKQDALISWGQAVEEAIMYTQMVEDVVEDKDDPYA